MMLDDLRYNIAEAWLNEFRILAFQIVNYCGIVSKYYKYSQLIIT